MKTNTELRPQVGFLPVRHVILAHSETEAAWLLRENVKGTKVIAGGTDLMLQMENNRFSPTVLIDIRKAGMTGIKYSKEGFRIGAMTTASEMQNNLDLRKFAHGVWDSASTLSVPAIRNMATISGNIANSSPAADMVPALMAMDTKVTIRHGDDFRQVELSEFSHGPGRNCLQHGDLITEICIPFWKEDAFHYFQKCAFRDAQVIAIVSLAFSCEMQGARISRIGIALGSVAATVKRAAHVEEFLMNKELTLETAQKALELLKEDISPISDLRSEAAYRLQVAQNYLGEALSRLLQHRLKSISSSQMVDEMNDPSPRPENSNFAAKNILEEFLVEGQSVKIVESSQISYMPRDQSKKV